MRLQRVNVCTNKPTSRPQSRQSDSPRRAGDALKPTRIQPQVQSRPAIPTVNAKPINNRVSIPVPRAVATKTATNRFTSSYLFSASFLLPFKSVNPTISVRWRNDDKEDKQKDFDAERMDQHFKTEFGAVDKLGDDEKKKVLQLKRFTNRLSDVAGDSGVSLAETALQIEEGMDEDPDDMFRGPREGREPVEKKTAEVEDEEDGESGERLEEPPKPEDFIPPRLTEAQATSPDPDDDMNEIEYDRRYPKPPPRTPAPFRGVDGEILPVWFRKNYYGRKEYDERFEQLSEEIGELGQLPIMNPESKQKMWELYHEDPEYWSYSKLGGHFKLPGHMVKGILLLKQREHELREKGELIEGETYFGDEIDHDYAALFGADPFGTYLSNPFLNVTDELIGEKREPLEDHDEQDDDVVDEDQEFTLARYALDDSPDIDQVVISKTQQYQRIAHRFNKMSYAPLPLVPPLGQEHLKDAQVVSKKKDILGPHKNPMTGFLYDRFDPYGHRDIIIQSPTGETRTPSWEERRILLDPIMKSTWPNAVTYRNDTIADTRDRYERIKKEVKAHGGPHSWATSHLLPDPPEPRINKYPYELSGDQEEDYEAGVSKFREDPDGRSKKFESNEERDEYLRVQKRVKRARRDKDIARRTEEIRRRQIKKQGAAKAQS